MVSLCVIAGTAGAGKTSLALRWAQQAQHRFPDKQLYINLRGYEYVEAYWLIGLGAAQLALGQHGEALDSYQRSASLNRRLRNRGREALAWLGAGRTYQALGRHDEAADFHRQAAATFGELGDPWHRAVALEALADTLNDTHPDQAAAHRAEALRLIAPYDDLRATRARDRIAHHLPPEPRPTT